MRHLSAAVYTAALLLWPRPGAAGESALTLEDVLARASARAPAIAAARASVGEMRARLLGASAFLRNNPGLQGGAGARLLPGSDLLEGGVGVRQVFELGGRRRARIDAAEAAVAAAVAGANDVQRQILRQAAVSFYTALHAGACEKLAREAADLAAETHRVAERRHRAGDVPILEVNVAGATLARARAAAAAAAADLEASLGQLRLAVAMDADEPLALHGDLRQRRPLRPELLQRAPERSDLRALAAEVEEARADARLGRGLQWPDVGVGAEYERDDGNDVAMGTLSLTLPVFERGQGVRAEAAARERRMEETLQATRRQIEVEVRTAFEVQRRREEAVAELERSALPGLDANASLAQRSYQVGELSLADLVTLSGLMLETKRDYLDRLLEAAVAGVDVEASAGVLQ